MLSDYDRNILKVNLWGLLAGAAVWGVVAGFSNGAGLLFFGFQIGLQAVANFLLGVVHLFGQPKGRGRAAGYWLSALLVLIIGTGSCGLMGSLVF